MIYQTADPVAFQCTINPMWIFRRPFPRSETLGQLYTASAVPRRISSQADFHVSLNHLISRSRHILHFICKIFKIKSNLTYACMSAECMICRTCFNCLMFGLLTVWVFRNQVCTKQFFSCDWKIAYSSIVTLLIYSRQLNFWLISRIQYWTKKPIWEILWPNHWWASFGILTEVLLRMLTFHFSHKHTKFVLV